MSNPPDIVTGELETVASEPTEEQLEQREMWLTGTEIPGRGRWTGEGLQEMERGDEGVELAGQRGTLIDDDYLAEVPPDEAEIQIINMGPQHPATHGVLRLTMELDGEIIRRVKPVIGYLHTGMEKTAEALTFAQGSTNVTRMDYLSPFHNELAYSLAVEQLLGVEIPPRAEVTRILMTELNRLASHLVWVATQGMDVGALSMMLYGFRERERILEFFEKTTGLRMNHNYIRPGGIAADLPDGWEQDVEEILEIIPKGMEDYETLLTENPIFLERTQGIGVITPAECKALGVTGPAARAAGVPFDLRKAFPYSGIEEYDFEVPTGKHGDVYDRYLVRLAEMRQSLGIVRQAAERMPEGDFRTDDRKVTPPPRSRIDQSMEALIHHFKLFTEGFKVPEGEVYQAVESPRGELGMHLVSSGGAKPWRLHVRAPSFANVQALPVMLSGSLIADTVATLASLDPVLGDVDR